MNTNTPLRSAKEAKNDEFYTRLPDVEKEMWQYRDQFRGRRVYCDCDDPATSAFVQYFKMHFEGLGLKSLHATGISLKTGKGMEFSMEAGVGKTRVKGDGDFRSDNSRAIRAKCDIVVTNPPFSMFQEYMATLMEWSEGGGSSASLETPQVPNIVIFGLISLTAEYGSERMRRKDGSMLPKTGN